jgi:hypothetical protein
MLRIMVDNLTQQAEVPSTLMRAVEANNPLLRALTPIVGKL